MDDYRRYTAELVVCYERLSQQRRRLVKEFTRIQQVGDTLDVDERICRQGEVEVQLREVDEQMSTIMSNL